MILGLAYWPVIRSMRTTGKRAPQISTREKERISDNSKALERTTVHLLSKKSIAQERDAFLFNHEPPVSLDLAGGLNSKKHKISIKTFYHWIDTIDDEGIKIEFQLWKINLKREGLLTYSATRTGDPLLRPSLELLQPGDYALYTDDGQPDSKPIGFFVDADACANFAQKERSMKNAIIEFPKEKEFLENLMHHNYISPELTDKIKQRDCGVCFFIGRTPNSTWVCWLVPPVLGETCESDVTEILSPEQIQAIYADFKSDSNLIVLDQELFAPFMQNQFGVDVEDNYKIVIFRDFPGHLKLGQNLPVASAQPNRHKFLNGNFKRCLGHQFLGGAIQEDYPDLGSSYMDIVDEEGLEALEGRTSPIAREILDLFGGSTSDEEEDDDEFEGEGNDDEDG